MPTECPMKSPFERLFYSVITQWISSMHSLKFEVLSYVQSKTLLSICLILFFKSQFFFSFYGVNTKMSYKKENFTLTNSVSTYNQ